MTGAGRDPYRRRPRPTSRPAMRPGGTAINGYPVPLGEYEVPPDNPALRRLHAHARDGPGSLLRRDCSGPARRPTPDRFRRRRRRSRRGRVRLGRRRGALVPVDALRRPGEQAAGIGRALPRQRVLPSGTARRRACSATVADDAPSRSRTGCTRRSASCRGCRCSTLVGRPSRPRRCAPLPAGVHAVRFDATAAGRSGPAPRRGARRLDREILGSAHPDDHDSFDAQGRSGSPTATRGRTCSATGTRPRSGASARSRRAIRRSCRRPRPTCWRAVEPRGASAVWVPGAAGPTHGDAVRAGLRIEGFPVLACWSRPFADFSRYLPISPGLV